MHKNIINKSMTSELIFSILVGILSISFIVDRFISRLNASHFNNEIPEILNDVYEKEAYLKSQAYKKENAKFSSVTSSFTFVVTIVFLFLDGFKFVDEFVRQFSSNEIFMTAAVSCILHRILSLVSRSFRGRQDLYV